MKVGLYGKYSWANTRYFKTAKGQKPRSRSSRSIDQIQQRMQAQLTKTVKAYRAFAAGHTPPQPAKDLRTLLVQLTGTELAIAHEHQQLSAFAPRYSALLNRAKTAGTELSRALAAVKPPVAHKIRGTKAQVQADQAAFAAAASAAVAQQADAVDANDAKIAAVAARLRKLHPPSVMRPGYLTQLKTHDASRRSGLALALELRKQNRSNVAVLGRKFTLAARIAGTVSAQKAPDRRRQGIQPPRACHRNAAGKDSAGTCALAATER